MAKENRTIKEYRGWSIRPRDNGTWQIDNGDYKHRVRTVLPTLGEAQAEIDRRKARMEKYGLNGDGLTDKARVEAAEALTLLNGRATQEEAARFWLQHHPGGEEKTMKHMVDVWLNHQIQNNYRPTSFRQNKQRINAFMESVGADILVSSITRNQALEFIAKQDCDVVTKFGWRKVLHSFFQFCLGDDEAIPPIPQVIAANPLARKRKKGGSKILRDQKQPHVWEPGLIERVMHKAEEMYPQDVAAFAILFFAGIRPGEIGGGYGIEAEEVTKAKDALAPFTAALEMAQQKKRMAVGTKEWNSVEAERVEMEKARMPYLLALRKARQDAKRKAKLAAEVGKDRLRWEHVDLQARTIHVPPEIAKTRTARYVDISDNLLLWLTKYHKHSGYVSASEPTFKRHREAIMKALGIDGWPQDVARHSFASYHLAEFENIEKTQLQMGHTTEKADVLFTRYRKLVTKQKAAAFWAIRPKSYTEGTREAHIRIA